jgi:hypothetical protein
VTERQGAGIRSEILHILKGRLRRLWPQVALSLAVLAMYTGNEDVNRGLLAKHGFTAFGSVMFGVLFLPASWWLLIAGIFREESPAAVAQPPEDSSSAWRKSLPARLLLVAITINVPLFVSQLCLLAGAGFLSVRYLPSVLWMQMLITAMVLLPMAALAAVTRKLWQTILLMPLLLVYLADLYWLSETAMDSGLKSVRPVSLALQIVAAVGACCGAMFWQYAEQKTKQARWLLVAGAVAVAVIMIVTPNRWLVGITYPLAAGTSAPAQLTLLDPLSQPSFQETEEGRVQVDVPLLASARADDSALMLEGAMLSLETPDGMQWSSGWRSSDTLLLGRQSDFSQHFFVPREIFDGARKVPVRARVSLAVASLHAYNSQRVVLPVPSLREFEVAGPARCSLLFGAITCRSPLRKPSFLILTTELSASTCDHAGEVPDLGQFAAFAWVSGTGSGPAQFGLSPVMPYDLVVSGRRNLAGRSPIPDGMFYHRQFFCEGTPVTFSQAELTGRARIELQIENFKLAEYGGTRTSGNRDIGKSGHRKIG